MLHNYDDCLSEPFHAQNIRSNTYVKHEILIYSIKLILFELRARIIYCSFTRGTKIETDNLSYRTETFHKSRVPSVQSDDGGP